MSMSVYLCACVSVCDHIFGTTRSILTANCLCLLPMAVARSSSGGVVMFYIMDDVMFAHKPRFLDVASQLKCSAHAALGLAVNFAQ